MNAGRGRLFITLIPALVGAAMGYAYGRFFLQAPGSLPSAYGALGGVAGVLGLRVFYLIRAVLNDFFGRDS